MTTEGGTMQIPAMLRGGLSPPSDSKLGSKEYSKPSLAVILGAGYDDADTEVMMKASTNIRPIPWLRPDMTKPTPPLGSEYGKSLVACVKELLARLVTEGNMSDEEVYWY